MFAPPDQGYWEYGGVRSPIVSDRGGSMEENGAQIGIRARREGTYRIRVRGLDPDGEGCPRYTLAFLRGRTTLGPETVH